MNKLFEACGWTGNAWMISDEFRENVDVISSAAVYFRENGEYTAELSEKRKKPTVSGGRLSFTGSNF